jgi:tol-pal system protein YbgF
VKKFLWVFLLAAGFVFWGCATTDDLKRTRHDVDQKVNVLKEETARLQKGLDESREAEKALRKNQADTGADLTELREQIKKLRGTAEELRRDLDNLRAERREKDAKLKDIGLRIGFIENFIGVGKKSEPGENAVRKEDKKGNSHRAAKNGNNGKSNGYSLAYKDFKSARYEDARRGFQKYLEKNPNTDLSDNAQFWIGETYYLENNYEKAILEYEKVIKNFPDGDRVPHALLKQGLSFLKLGDEDSGKLLLQQVVKDYPATGQAKIAKAKLKELKE